MDLFDKLVEETLSSGIEPLQLSFTRIYNLHTGYPIAYRTDTTLFSTVCGELSQKDYAAEIEGTTIGTNLTLKNIKKAIKCIKKFKENDRKVLWISVKSTASFLTDNDVHATLTKVFAEMKFDEADKLCLEFDRAICFADREKVQKGIADLKVLGVRSMIGDFDQNNFPMTALTTLPVDIVVLSPEITAIGQDRNKVGVLPALIRFVRSMNISVVAAGIETDDQIREMNKAECIGFIADENYRGKFELVKEKNDFLSVLNDKEED